MSTNEVSTLLEILDSEYLKPILIDRFAKIDDLARVNLNDVGVQNEDDANKLRYALHDLQANAHSVERYDPILSIKESDGIITRLENETNLVSSSLNLLLNKNTHLPRDDATFDLDYSLHSCEIDQVEADVRQLQQNAEELLEQIHKQYPLTERTSTEPRSADTNHLSRTSFILVSLSILCIGVMFYIKQK